MNINAYFIYFQYKKTIGQLKGKRNQSLVVLGAFQKLAIKPIAPDMIVQKHMTRRELGIDTRKTELKNRERKIEQLEKRKKRF